MRNDYKYVQVEKEVYNRIRKLALFNELEIRVLASALLREILADEQKVDGLIEKLKTEKKGS